MLDNALQVLLVQRPAGAGEPYPGCWALPGGLADVAADATLEDCARRKLFEKTGVKSPYLEQLGSWASATRDPRRWSATHVWFALISAEDGYLTKGANAAEVAWFEVDAVTQARGLAFDHDEILEAAVERLRSKVEYTSLPAFLLPEPFTLPQLQRVYETVLGRPVDNPLRNPLAFSQFESTLINALIYGQPNSARTGLRKPVGALAPFFVRRVEEFIRANVHEPLTIEQLAEHSGVSASTLFAGFRNYYGLSPMAYVRQLRLERVRAELVTMEQSSASSITEIATKWGFAHLGRFSMDYKRHFGESPSTSVRLRKSSS